MSASKLKPELEAVRERAVAAGMLAAAHEGTTSGETWLQLRVDNSLDGVEINVWPNPLRGQSVHVSAMVNVSGNGKELAAKLDLIEVQARLLASLVRDLVLEPEATEEEHEESKVAAFESEAERKGEMLF